MSAFTVLWVCCRRSGGVNFRTSPLPASQEEIKAIVSKRRDFEYLLVRRAPEKADYLRYIAYELNLDALRLKRKVRLGEWCPLDLFHGMPPHRPALRVQESSNLSNQTTLPLVACT